MGYVNGREDVNEIGVEEGAPNAAKDVENSLDCLII